MKVIEAIENAFTNFLAFFFVHIGTFNEDMETKTTISNNFFKTAARLHARGFEPVNFTKMTHRSQRSLLG